MGALTPSRSAGIAESFILSMEGLRSSVFSIENRGKRTDFTFYRGMLMRAGFSLQYGDG